MRNRAERSRADHGTLTTALTRLTDSPRPRTRAQAADQAADLFRTDTPTRADVEAAVAELVAATLADDDNEVREATLHACGEAAARHRLPLALFEPLLPLMPALPPDLIGYVLAILATTQDPAARDIIEPYRTHPDPTIQEAAAQSITEISEISG